MRRSSKPELQILQPILVNLTWLVLATAIAGAIAYDYFRRQAPIYPVRAELIARFGYEYTPVPTTQNSEIQQVNFRLDEVIGSEIQLLTSMPLLARALDAAPYPETPDVKAPFTAQSAADHLGVERIEGSTVLVMTVNDPDTEWAKSFLSALIPLYFEERRRLFTQTAFDDMLAEDESELEEARNEAMTNSATVANDLADALAAWDSGLTLLARVPERAGDVADLEARFSALLIKLSGRAETASIVQWLARYARAQQQPTLAPQEAPADSAGELAALRATFTAIEAGVEDSVRLAAELKDVEARLDANAVTLRRQKVRAAGSEGIAVLTPPYASERASGLDPAVKGALAGVLAFLFGAMIVVIARGTRNLR